MLRVVRVGGSLLTWGGIVPALSDWLALQLPSSNVLIAGGGPWVELLRHAADRYGLSDEEAHWMCVRTMRTTADLLATLLDLKTVTSLEQIAGHRPSSIVFDVDQFLRSDRESPDCLPCNWNVTSDSIAARVADRLAADELVLLKSVAPPTESGDRTVLANLGYVDRHFPVAAKHLRKVRCVNLRS